MKKIILRLFATTTAVFLMLLLLAWLGLRASLPQLDGELSELGLSASATIQRDAAGIPVITAANRLDLAFATGFVHGQDRFFQMDMIRRQSAGELSEIVGAVAIDVDKRFRFHRFRSRAKVVLAAAPAAHRELLERYADGLNAGRD